MSPEVLEFKGGAAGRKLELVDIVITDAVRLEGRVVNRPQRCRVLKNVGIMLVTGKKARYYVPPKESEGDEGGKEKKPEGDGAGKGSGKPGGK